MNDQELTEMKEVYIEKIKEYMSEAGSLFPHITVFAEHVDENDTRPAIIHIPIPDKYMESDDTKEEFIKDVVPSLAEKVKEDFKTVAVGWASEAWMRSVNKDEELPKNYKDLPIKKEVVIVTLETADKSSIFIYDIIRKGKQVNEEGDLIDIIELVEDKDLTVDAVPSPEGRFTGLYKKFKM